MKKYDYDDGSIIRIKPLNFVKIKAMNSKDNIKRYFFDCNSVSKDVVLIKRFIFEMSNGEIFVKECRNQTDDLLKIFFEKPINVAISYVQRGIQNTEYEKNVNGIYIYPREVGAFTVNKSEEEQVNSSKNDDINNYKETSEITSEIDEIECNKEYLNNLKAELKIKKANYQNVLDTIDSLKSQISETEKKISQKNSQKSSLENELANLNIGYEALKLDCDKVSKKLDEFKSRLNMNNVTVSLLEDDNVVELGCISKNIEKVSDDIEKIEKNISKLVKLKMKYNRIVDDAIIQNDGTISISDEVGGAVNG